MPFKYDEMLEISKKSEGVGISFDESEDTTRQEFKDECDVNHILRQHGYIVRPVQYGEHDFDQDLTSQMQARSVFQMWYDSAPVDVREAYPDLGSFLAAFGAGAFKTGMAGVEVPSSPDNPEAKPPEAAAQG